MGRLRRARMPMGRLGWALALVSTALSTVGPASAQSPTLPLEGDLSVQNHKMCVNINDDVVKVCKATDSETQALCSSACETAIRTALAHQECFNVIITTRSAPMTYEQSVQSHVNFHAYNCLPDEPAADAVSHAPGARRNALRARPLDPKVANECFVHEDRSDYRGFVNTTLSGYTCQKWSEQFPHHHPHAPSESNAWQGLGDHNYCRALSWDSCAWCYTTVHTPKWECCLIGSPQPSCPKKAFMPATDEISERERKVGARAGCRCASCSRGGVRGGNTPSRLAAGGAAACTGPALLSLPSALPCPTALRSGPCGRWAAGQQRAACTASSLAANRAGMALRQAPLQESHCALSCPFPPPVTYRAPAAVAAVTADALRRRCSTSSRRAIARACSS